MKKILLFLIITCPFMLNAQLGAFKIRHDAAIQIGYNNYKYLSFGNSGNAQYNNGAWAIEHHNGGLNFWKPWPSYSAGNYKFFLGDNGYVGIGMYPSSSNQSQFSWQHLKLQIDGRMCSDGNYVWSDEKLKLNINDIKNSTSLLMKLKPKSYNYKPNKFYSEQALTEDDVKNKTILAENERINSSSPSLGSLDFGFLAGDIKEVFPNLVTTVGEENIDAVNYAGLIPVLVKGFQDQQKQIEYLKAELQNVKTIDNLNNLPKDIGVIAYLNQNEPNPFDTNTKITYKIDSDFQNAKLIVTDFFGDVKTEKVIIDKGEGEFLLEGGSLESGTYYYSLIVNNVVVDTRIMFLIR